MTLASLSQLLAYAADLGAELERYAVTLVSPSEDEIVISKGASGSLELALHGRLPDSRRASPADLVLRERWHPAGDGLYARVEYVHELRHHGLGYRRAFHRHDEDQFARTFGVLTHEHCEAVMGSPTCRHYFGEPVRDAFDAFRRLYLVWLSGEAPDCAALRCLG